MPLTNRAVPAGIWFGSLVDGQRTPQISANHNISLCWHLPGITVENYILFPDQSLAPHCLPGKLAQLSRERLVLCHSIPMKLSQNPMSPGHSRGHMAQGGNSEGHKGWEGTVLGILCAHCGGPLPLRSPPVALSAWVLCGLGPPSRIRKPTRGRREQANGQRNQREGAGASCECLDSV